jgi:gliding motility-associated-like protein
LWQIQPPQRKILVPQERNFSTSRIAILVPILLIFFAMRYLIPFLLLALSASAQKEGSIWYFGEQAGMRFDGCKLEQLFDSQMETYEGCASIADEEGQLLFYTNGGGRLPVAGQSPGIIWNRDHEVMYDMMGMEGGGFSAAQSSVIIPRPGSDSRYFLFTMEEVEFNIDGDPVDRGLSYFEIDMNLNGGLGGVILANVNLYKPSFEGVAAALHANGEDYWIIAIDDDSKDFVVIPVDSDGPGSIQLESSGGMAFSGQIKVSPDRQWLYSGQFLFRFNPETGNISQPLQVLQTGSLGVSFSPNSRYLFAISNTISGAELIRFDLEAPDILASEILVESLPVDYFFGYMQLGPDGNIYFLQADLLALEEMRLARVRCPNIDQVFYEPDLLTFPTSSSFGLFLGLPNFPDHLFADEREVPYTLDLGPDTLSLCPGETLTLSTGIDSLNFCELEVLGWSTGELSDEIEVLEPGTYAVTVAAFCGKQVDSVLVVPGGELLELVFPEENLILCPDDSLLLSPEVTGAEGFAWSTGDSSLNLLLTEPGNYSLTVTDACGNSISEEAEVAPWDPLVFSIQADSTRYCTDNLLRLFVTSASLADSLSWRNGQTADSIQAEPGQTIGLSVFTPCEILEFSLLAPEPLCSDCFALPNLFTPNNDGLNDFFLPVIRCPEVRYSLQVFSRFGQLVYEGRESDPGWDGKEQKSGNELPPDAYIYQLVIEEPGLEEQRFSGELVLLR